MKRDLIAVVILIIVICLFCQDIFLFNQSPDRGDIPLQFYPWKAYTRDMLADGEIPYWNPYTYGGAPFLANMQSAVFYPLDLILFVFPMERFYGYSLVLHLILAGAGTYLLARKCGATPFPGLLAGIAYALNGFTMIHIPAGNHLTYAGAAWAPWMFWITIGFVQDRKSRLPWGLGAVLIVLLHFLCGHPQMMFYSLFFSMALCLILGLWESKRIYDEGATVAFVRAIVLGFFMLLGLALAGMQLYPTLEYLEHANRASSLDLEMATEFSFAPHRLITLLFPEFYGTQLANNHYDHFYFWSCAYAGVIIPIFAIALFFLKKKPSSAAIPLGMVGLLALFLAWGRGNPVYALVMQLPGFGHFRAPAKFLPYYLVPVCTLAAMGLERVCGMVYDQQKKEFNLNEFIRRFLPLVVLFGLIFFYGASRLANLTDALRSIHETNEIVMIKFLSLTSGGLLLLAALALFLFSQKIPRYPRLAISFSMILLLCLDLFIYGQEYLNFSLSRVEKIERRISAPEEIDLIDNPPDRVVTLREISYPNMFIHWRTPTIAGYDPMSLRSYNQLIGEMEGWEEGELHDNIQLDQYHHPALDKLNVRYVLTLRTLEDPGLNLLETEGNNFTVYERQSEQRCWAAVAEKTKDDPQSISSWTPISTDVNSYEPHQIQFSLNKDGPFWLRVSEWTYPGWKAEAAMSDGKTEHLDAYTSQDGLRVYAIPSGINHIRLFYDPPLTGWIITVLALLIYILVIVLYILLKTDSIYPLIARLMGRYY